MADNVVELRGVARTFPGDPPVEAVRPTDLVVRRGEYVAVMGASGSGKSTLLHVIGLLDRPTEGTFLLDGVDVGELSDGRRTGLRGQRIGFVFQAFHLLPHRTVLENVMVAQVYNRSPRKGRAERATAALERVGLGHRLDFVPTKLSGGERQRVAIARAIVGNPALLLADEPTGNLDSVNTAAILDLLDEIHREGLTIMVITHDAEVGAHAGRSLVMKDGELRELVTT
ncbi:MAG: ABC transporter ATP-binding protein [Acidimicrobiia bacterium]